MDTAPTQQEWLGMSLIERSYWLLKFIAHSKKSEASKIAIHNSAQRSNHSYLHVLPDYDGSDIYVRSSVNQCVQWLVSAEYLLTPAAATNDQDSGGDLVISNKGSLLLNSQLRLDPAVHWLVAIELNQYWNRDERLNQPESAPLNEAHPTKIY